MANLSHKIALDPTAAQAAYFRRACGTARFVYNWALAEWKRQYAAGLKPNANALKKQFNAIKYQEFPWMQDIHRDAHARPFSALGVAFSGFFKGKSAYPTFKRKGERDSFYIANDKCSTDGRVVTLPRIGTVRMREPLRFPGKIMSAVVSHTAGRWFISFSVEVPDGEFCRERTGDGVVGVDVGITHAAVLSTGEKIENPRPLARALKKLRRCSRSLSRKQRGSKNRDKQRRKVARIHARVANIRRDHWNKISARLCRENQAVVIESLNVAGMVRNRSLSRAVVDSGFGMLGPMLRYKAPLYGTDLIEADRFYPSSKTCSQCGAVNAGLTLKDRAWRCPCGAEHDRDINAARNLANLALRGASAEVTPVRDEKAPKAARGRNMKPRNRVVPRP